MEHQCSTYKPKKVPEKTNTMKNTMQIVLSKTIGGLLSLGLALPLIVATSHAQSQPSAKVTAKTANLTLLPETTGTGDWQTVLANSIKTANQKDLFINS